ncbi:MAG: thiamine phosphate synthase [Chloroflexota bacterium]|nr:thiamine phosphate synthase [Chloroflexota bacterium]
MFRLAMDSSQSRFHFQVITNTFTPLADVADSLIGVLNAGADAVQLRDSAATPAQAAALADAIERGMPDARDRLILHERLIGPDVAGFAWRHVMSASIMRSGGAGSSADSRFGTSVHSLREARRAVELGAAYLTFGHVFQTGSHPGEPPRGIAALAEVVGCADVPVLAIGGLTTGNIDDVLASGCAGVAVISAVLSQPDPLAATHRLRALLDDSPHRPRFSFPTLESSSQEGTP